MLNTTTIARFFEDLVPCRRGQITTTHRADRPTTRRVSGLWCIPALVLLMGFGAGATLNTGIYHIGNSWTDQAYGVHDIAQGKGYVTTFGRNSIPGAPLSWLWEHPGDGFTEPCAYNSCLLQDQWDYTVLQPWGGDVATNTTYADNFCKLAYQGRSDATLFILACGPRKTEGLADYTANFEQRDQSYDRSKAYYEAIVNNLRSRNPGKRLGIVPLGNIMCEIHKKLEAGETVAGVASMADLYNEGSDGHLSVKGKYVECIAHFIAIFQADPRGAVISGATLATVPADFAADVCEIAWDVLQNYDYCRLGGTIPETDPNSPYLKVPDDSLRITNIRTSGAARGSYVPNVMADNIEPYTDRTYTLGSVGEFAGMAFVQTANSDKVECGDQWLSFDVDQDVTCYLPFLASESTPSWLASWQKTDQVLTFANGGSPYDIYTEDFPEGTVVLGGSCISGNTYFPILDGHGSSAVNHAPEAVVTATPTSGPAPLLVAFSGEQSSDPDADDYVWGYGWKFGDGTIHGSNMTVEHTYSEPGTYVAVMEVRDFAGLTDTAHIEIQVSDSTTATLAPRNGLSPTLREAPRYFGLRGRSLAEPHSAGVIIRLTPRGAQTRVIPAAPQRVPAR